MFRKPMRLERWVAYDGAIGAEVVDAINETADPESENNNPDLHEGFGEHAANGDDSAEFGGYTGFTLFSPMDAPEELSNSLEFEFLDGGDNERTATLRLPGDVDTSEMEAGEVYLPFISESGVRFRSSGIHSQYFFFEIDNPTDGKLGLYDINDVSGSGRDFVEHYDINNGTWIAFYDSSTADANGVMKIVFKEVYKGRLVNSDYGNLEGVVDITGDGLRFMITRRGETLYGNTQVQTVFRSLTFTPDVDAPATLTCPVSVYYQRHGGYSNNPEIFSDPDNSAFNGTAKGTAVIGEASGTVPEVPGGEDEDNPDLPSKPEEPGVPDPTEPEPEPEPEPDPDPDPVPEPEPEPTPLPPIFDSGSDADSSNGDTGIGDGDGSGQESGEAEAGGGDADNASGSAGDNGYYIFTREEEEELAPAQGPDRPAEAVEVEEVQVQDRMVESALASTLMELSRDAETLLAATKLERDSLANALTRLQEEYLSREVGDWRDLRSTLQEWFSQGNREMRAVNRVIEEMHRHMAEFHNHSLDRRDGMITESLRELMDSASRRGGETTALSHALNAVADELRDSRLDNQPPPAPETLTGIFSRTISEATEGWLARSAKEDPMGRELAGQMAMEGSN